MLFGGPSVLLLADFDAQVGRFATRRSIGSQQVFELTEVKSSLRDLLEGVADAIRADARPIVHCFLLDGAEGRGPGDEDPASREQPLIDFPQKILRQALAVPQSLQRRLRQPETRRRFAAARLPLVDQPKE